MATNSREPRPTGGHLSNRNFTVTAPGSEGRAAPWARGVALTLVLVLAATLAWREAPEVDFGFHLAAGRFILERHAWPSADPFTYTVPGATYIDMNGLFQVFLTLFWSVGGDVGKNLLVEALILGTTLVLWRHARRRGVASPTIMAVGFALGLLSWEMRFAARPELATYLLLAVQLYVLRRHVEDGRPAWLYALPLLQVVWVYAHSLSLIGVTVTGLYALTGLVGARRRDPAPWVALTASGVALLLNPYGWRGVEFLWSLRTRLSAGNVFAEQIQELKSPFSAAVHDIWPVLAFKVALVAGAALMLARVRRRAPLDGLLFAVFALLAATAVRNVGVFVVGCLPPVLEAAQELRDVLAHRGRLRRPALLRLARAGPAAAAVGLVFVAGQVVLGGYYVADLRPERFGAGLSDVVTPKSSVDYIENNRLPGPIYNDLRFGGYLLGRLWPRERVFIDGRLEVIGEAFYRRYLEVSSGAGWDVVVRRYDPNLALVATTSRALAQRLAADPEWAVVEVDGASVLFVRRRPQNAGLIAQAEERFKALDRPGGPDDAPLAPRTGESWLAGILTPRVYPWGARGRGNAFMLLGLDNAARRAYRQALIEAGRDEPSLAFNFASANYRRRRYDEARVWYRRVLDLDPGNPVARERLATIP